MDEEKKNEILKKKAILMMSTLKGNAALNEMKKTCERVRIAANMYRQATKTTNLITKDYAINELADIAELSSKSTEEIINALEEATNILIERITNIPNLTSINYKNTLYLILISILITIISGLRPAKKASKIEIVEALRNE